jgi:hypothetical protein
LDESCLTGSPPKTFAEALKFEDILDQDPNLKRLKSEILSSGLTIDDVQNSTDLQIGRFFEEYLHFSSLTGLKCAQALKKLSNLIL